MKRRKKPFLLITVLVICAGLVFVMNAPATTPKPGQPPTSDPAPPPATDVKGVPAPNKGDVAADVKKNMAAQPATPGGKGGPHGMFPPGKGPKMDGPSIMSQNVSGYSPVPSDTSVNGGWYSDKAPPSYAPPKKN